MGLAQIDVVSEFIKKRRAINSRLIVVDFPRVNVEQSAERIGHSAEGKAQRTWGR